MCDVLTETHAPTPQEVDEALKRAITQCRETFRHRPDSPSKLSVVSALQDVGQASLRDKIDYRAKKEAGVAEGNFS